MIVAFRLPGTLYCAPGCLALLGEEAGRLTDRMVMLVTDPGIAEAGIADRAAEVLAAAGIGYRIFTGVEQEPSAGSLAAALDFFRQEEFGLVLGVGGGSALDVAKGVSVLARNEGSILDYAGVEQVPRPGVPMILVPTTAGTGAEVTPNAVFTDPASRLKKGVVSRFLIPDAAFVDAELTHSVPPGVTAATGMDALTHAIESYTSPRATPLTEMYSLEAVRLIGVHLRRAVACGTDVSAREGMARGSLLAGIALANAGVAGVHALAYPLGGGYGIPHGIANSLLLPYVMEFNVVGDLERFARLSEALGAPAGPSTLREKAFQAVRLVRELSRDTGIPQTLREVGIPEEAIGEMAEKAAATERLLRNNPRRMTRQDVEAVYRSALGDPA